MTSENGAKADVNSRIRSQARVALSCFDLFAAIERTHQGFALLLIVKTNLNLW